MSNNHATASEVLIRKASLADVDAMKALIDVFAERNAVLARDRSSVVTSLRDFFVAQRNGDIIGCCALPVIDDDLVEIRTLVVGENTQGLGVGRKLVEACVREARALGFSTVFALTRVDGFFGKLGFAQTPMSSLSQKVWLDCAHCPSFPNCDEIAEMRKL